MTAPSAGRPAEHGTVTRYCGGCRCQACRTAHAERARHRRRMKAYGRWTPRSVPNTGARRRVEALMCLGWSMRALSRMLGWNPDRLTVALGAYDGISPVNHERIVALYERLWDVAPPARTRSERAAVARTKASAARRGFRPPMDWDDLELDAPSQLRPHGTHAAYARHKASGQRPCARCVRGERAYQARRVREARRRALAEAS